MEQGRKDHEEKRQLWRETQRQIDELGPRMTQLSDRIEQLAIETRDRIDQLAAESRAADQRLGERLDSLISAIGVLVKSMSKE